MSTRNSGLYAVACLLASCGLQVSAAGYEIAWCDRCEPAEYGRSAMGLLSGSQGGVYVVNRPEHIVKFYTVTTKSEPGVVVSKARKVNGDPEVIEKIKDALSVYDAWAALDSMTQLSGLTPESAYDSAVDLIGSPERQQNIADAINEFVQRRTSDTLSLPIVSSLLFYPYNDPKREMQIGIVTKMAYTDGSFNYFELIDVRKLEDGSIELVHKFKPASGKDAQDRPIPQYPNGLATVSPIAGENVKDYVELARRLEVPINMVCASGSEQLNCMEAGDRSSKVGYTCTYSTKSACQ